MINLVELKPANPAHYDFALSLYLAAMRPYAAELMAWDEAAQVASFARQWKHEDVRIIVHDGRVVGWMQATETPSEIFLQQMFIAPEDQRHGFGTEVMKVLFRDWEPTKKPVVLTVLKNNPAQRLYGRLGFVIVEEMDVKFKMRREP